MAYDQVLEALGDATRRRIIEELRSGPAAVGELAARFPVSRPAISQHLRVLSEAGLVTQRREGTRRIYSLASPGLWALREYVETFWDMALGRLKQHVERKPTRRRKK